jgi:hypothetical protein
MDKVDDQESVAKLKGSAIEQLWECEIDERNQITMVQVEHKTEKEHNWLERGLSNPTGNK